MFLTLIFMNNGDQCKYGELMKDLKQQHLLGNDQYPKNMNAAIDALNSHKWDQVYINHQKINKNNEKEQQQ